MDAKPLSALLIWPSVAEVACESHAGVADVIGSARLAAIELHRVVARRIHLRDRHQPFPVRVHDLPEFGAPGTRRGAQRPATRTNTGNHGLSSHPAGTC